MNYTFSRYYSIFQPDSVNAWNCNGQSRAIEYIYSTLAKVHRSSSKSHGLFFPVFIHRILLHLGLEDFPASEPVHIITPIGATFLRQRATQMKASSKRPRVKSSTGASRPPTLYIYIYMRIKIHTTQKLKITI